MRTVIWGLLIAAGSIVVVATIESRGNDGFADRLAGANTVPRGLIALKLTAGAHLDYVALVDPERRVMGVYQIDPSSGEIQLKSVRNVQWDLQMDEFNGTSPAPRDVRAMLK